MPQQGRTPKDKTKWSDFRQYPTGPTAPGNYGDHTYGTPTPAPTPYPTPVPKPAPAPGRNPNFGASGYSPWGTIPPPIQPGVTTPDPTQDPAMGAGRSPWGRRTLGNLGWGF